MEKMPVSASGVLSRLGAALFFLCAASAQTLAPGAKQDPQFLMWQEIKRSLEGPDGRHFFDYNLKDAVLPAGVAGVHSFIGTVVSSRLQKSPSEIVLAISDASTPEVTLRLVDEHGKRGAWYTAIPPGTKVAFEGVIEEFSQKPFMLTLEVDPYNYRSLSVLEENSKSGKK